MSKMGSAGWIITFIVAGLIDITQFLIGLFGAALSVFVIGAALVAANEAADPIIGAIAIGWFELRGIRMILHLKRLLSLLGAGGIAELTGGVASLWIFDVWYLYHDVKKEEAQIRAQQQSVTAEVVNNSPSANVDGRREPPARQQLNKHDVRLPSGQIAHEQELLPEGDYSREEEGEIVPRNRLSSKDSTDQPQTIAISRTRNTVTPEQGTAAKELAEARKKLDTLEHQLRFNPDLQDEYAAALEKYKEARRNVTSLS